MKTKALLFLVALGVTACASTHMKQYVGKDIREVILDDGQPIDAIDMGDGVRAFVYPFGGGTYVMPSVSTTSGSVSRSGWLSATTITSPGGVINIPPCRMTYFARWDATSGGWIIHEYRIPKQTFC